ncbi:hypothetical protein G4B88_019337 [Cannabis sativa]|uniref:Elongator complex protein 1 n=1 Tax=Cannabis sativa TaxID=3483 RepID=A0A7J6DYK2_CANSA|nr:hypothetical protein G4B88_019337 [Cannabis sativa]
MNNLKLYSEVSLCLELHSNEGEIITFSAFDVERNRLFFASSTNSIYATHLSSFQNEGAWRKTMLPVEVDQIELEDGDCITSFDYVMEKEALLLGTQSGLMLLHNVDGKFTEVVGQVEGGVKCISPSPDGDLLCIVTGFEQMLVMTHDWDLLYETSLRDLPDGVDIHVEPNVSSRNEFSSLISWRGDGKYFGALTNESDSTSLLKRLKVWERDSGVVHAASEPKLFMGPVLDWMPSGAKIASVYDRKAENECPSIVFYEKNGLERSLFSINEEVNSKIEMLKWNCNSDLLAALVRCENYDCIKVWFFSNNHWYLKHEIRYSREDKVCFMWDPVKQLQLICWTLGGQVTLYNFNWSTAIMEDSTALVIDGSKILVTPLSLSLMPPPMYLFSLKFPSAVRDLAFYSRNSKHCLAASLSNGCLCVVEFPSNGTWEELEGKEFNIESSISDMPLGSFIHLTWLDSHRVLAVSHYGFSHSNVSHGSLNEDRLLGHCLLEIELVCSEDNVPGSVTCSGWHANVSNQLSLEEVVVGIAPNYSTKSSAFIQFYGGKIYEHVPKLGIFPGAMKYDDRSFSSSCPWMSVVPVGNTGPLIFGLDEVGRLHISGKILCNNCSSFSFYSNLADQVMTHLILSTKQDFVFIVDLYDILHGDLEEKYTNFIHVNKRREEDNVNFINIWERGAKIAGVLHGDEATVILQTTRGNLECFYPRKLVLLSICNALVNQRFKDALLMLRRHRIDFNVIVDYCSWQLFLQSASEFVKQVNNLSYITEFVCALKNENIMETLYKKFNCKPFFKEDRDVQARYPIGSDSTSKVSSILRAIRVALEDSLPESPARELCILTTLARSDPPALEEALERIKFIREMELLGSEDPRRTSYPSAEEALKHLLWLSDSEPVFEAALGLYDLNLAAIVALNSQRDPKEFLPFLQELERLPLDLMCYNIDLKLCRFDKALKHIISAGDAYYADCMNLMKLNPQLFPLGLKLISDPVKKKQILEAWGDHLSDEKHNEDAAATYLCCSSLEKALKSYRACGNWSGVLTIAGLLKLGREEILQLAHELCEELQALGKPGEAAQIALEYCGDVSSGINLLISAREWEEALRVAVMHNRQELISEVKSASLDCASVLIGEYEEGLEKVGKYLARYLAVRQRRLLLAAKIQSEEQAMTDLDDDTASEASSNFSGMSAYTTGSRSSRVTSVSSSATSKARDTRRQRKRGKIRPGSAGEEMALVEHLKGMCPTVGAKRELKSLLLCLAMLGEVEIARKLQRAGENFQLSQLAAVSLAEDTVTNDIMDEYAHTLEHYTQKMRGEVQSSEAFFWRCKARLPMMDYVCAPTAEWNMMDFSLEKGGLHVRDKCIEIISHDQNNDSDTDAKVPKYYDVMMSPTYLVGLDTLKADLKSYQSVLAWRNSHCWQKCFSLSLTLSSLLSNGLPAHGPLAHGSDGRIEVCGSWSRQSSYILSRTSRMNEHKQYLTDNEQALETATLIFNQEVDKFEALKEALHIISRALEADPRSISLWIFHFLIYYSSVKSTGNDDLFSYAVKYNQGSYELWLMYINSCTHINDRLSKYYAALSALCFHSTASDWDRLHASACILDLFLQMVDCLCMSGNVEKAIQKIFELLAVDSNSDEPAVLLSDIHARLTVSDKFIFWISCVYLVIYRKLPDAVVQQFECEKQASEIEWPSIILLDDEKQRAVKLIEKGMLSIDSLMKTESLKDDINLTSAHFFAVNHIRCMVALDNLECSRNLLDKYLGLFPSCLELVLIRAHEKDFGDLSFSGFEEILGSWPKEVPGIQCIWNQYAQCAVQSKGYECGKVLMDRWFHSVWKVHDLQNGMNSENIELASDSILESLPNLSPIDVMFGFLNLSLYKLMQNDRLGASIAVEKALKASIPKYFKYCIGEHAMFLLTGELLLKENASVSGVLNILERYIGNSLPFSVPEPLPRKFIKNIKKPRVRQLMSNIFSPVSSDFSLVNLVLELWYGPTFLLELLCKPKLLVDFVQGILDISSSNYELAMSVCRHLSSPNSSTDLTPTSILFWASSNLVQFCMLSRFLQSMYGLKLLASWVM